jgi:hypothetical protein
VNISVGNPSRHLTETELREAFAAFYFQRHFLYNSGGSGTAEENDSGEETHEE